MSPFRSIMYAAFADELEKIATIGALLGGAAGWAVSPNSIKGKVIGTAVGAGLGHVAGAGLNAAKQTFYDDYQNNNRAQVQGYIPAAAQQQYQGSRFY